MLRLHFGGWFQCRLAADPDPYDEPAGVSGTTIALMWEPPLDRVIRFNDPVAPRSHAAAVGVSVREVWRDDAIHPEHALHGARVDLRHDACFEGRNGLIADDGREPIVPFVLRISRDDVVLEREDPPGAWPADAVPDPLSVAHRLGGGVEASPAVQRAVLAAICVDDVEDWTRKRSERLAAEERGTTDPARLEGLRTRRDLLQPLAPVRVRYGFAVGQEGGRGTLHDPAGRVAEPLDLVRAWPLELWMGGWDADGMCGYVEGELRVPLREET
jgi:hypothetical protein